MRSGFFLPVFVFWLSLVIVITSVIWGTLSLYPQKRYLVWDFFIFVLTVWLLKTLFIPIGVPFFGSDAYVEVAATMEIDELGWFNLSPWNEGSSVWPSSTNYPLLSAVSLALANLAGIPLAGWARWGLSALSLVSIVLVYAIGYEMFHSQRIALLGSIGFGLTYMYLMFHSLYLRETIAFCFFLATVFSVIKVRASKENLITLFYRTTALICCLGVIFSHHLTAFLLLMFLLLLSLTDYSNKTLTIGENLPNTNKNQIHSSIWLFLFVALISYWIYLKQSPLLIAHSLLEDAFSGVRASSFSLPSTSRYTFLLPAQIFITLCIVLLALYKFFTTRKSQDSIYITAIIWGAITGCLCLIILNLGFPGATTLASRFELFGYTFLLPAAAYGAITLSSKKNWLIFPMAALFIAYGLLSVFRFHPFLYSSTEPDYENGEVRPVLLPEEYKLLTRIDTESSIASGSAMRRLSLPISGVRGAHLFENSKIIGQQYLDYDFLLTGERETQLQSAGHFGLNLEDLGLSRVYQAGSASIYTPLIRTSEEFHIEQLLSQEISRNDGWFIPGLYQWAKLTLVVILLCFSAIALVSLKKDFHPSELGLGIVLILFFIFLIYIVADFLGTEDFGSTFLILLLFISGSGFLILWRKWKFGKNLLFGIIIFCILVFGYGFVAEITSRENPINKYSEFYIESIYPCETNTCVILNLTNLEGKPINYQVDGYAELITLDYSKNWRGLIKYQQNPENNIEIQLDQSPNRNIDYSLFIQLRE
jgi:hypothetical protein